jgi:capsule polysaccharide export protein KpsE/RkpR
VFHGMIDPSEEKNLREEETFREVRQNEQMPGSALLQRLKAEQAFRELERREARLRLAARVRTLWAERTFLFRISAFGFILGLLIAFLIPPRYTSTTRLMPPDNHEDTFPQALMSLRAMGIGQIATDMLGLKSNSDIFVGILGSRTVQDKIINQFNLKQVYGTSRMDDVRKALASRVGISVDRKSDMITIAVTDHSPQRAAAIANAHVDELNRLVAELSTSSARRERVFLESFLVQVKEDLENTEKEFSQFASKNSAIDINEQGKALVGAAANLQGELIVAQAELEAIRQVYSDSHVRVRAAKARIEELQAQLRKLAGKDQENSVGAETTAAELYPSIRKLPLLGVTYADLYRKVKVQEVVHELLTQEYNLAKVQEARDLPTVKVLDPANVPDRKSFPPRLFIGILSTLLAFTSGVAIVLGSKSWNDRDPRDISKAVATEIWIDIKEKRFLNTGNGVSHPLGDNSAAPERKRGILSLLGLSNTSRHPNEYFSASKSFPESESREKKLPDTLNA